jgi:hypothetical protein
LSRKGQIFEKTRERNAVIWIPQLPVGQILDPMPLTFVGQTRRLRTALSRAIRILLNY